MAHENQPLINTQPIYDFLGMEKSDKPLIDTHPVHDYLEAGSMTELQRLMMANYGQGGKQVGLEELMFQRDHEKNFLQTQETIEELVARLTGVKLPEGVAAKLAPYSDSRYQEQDVGGNVWNPWSR